MRARPAGGGGDVAIGGDPAVRNAADGVADSRGKIGRFAPLEDSQIGD